MLKALLDNFVHLTLRTLFSLVAFMALVLIFLSFTDFPKYERYIFPLQIVKAKPERVSKNVWIGGYMDRDEMLEFLRKHRIGVVISLLDRDMYHERRLIEHERKFLRKAGIIFVSVPVKPLAVSEGSVKRLKFFLRRYKDRRIYVHSYLGRLRVRHVKEVLDAGKGS